MCVCVCVCLVQGPEGGPPVWCQVRCNVWCRGVTSVWCQVTRGSPCLVPGSVPCLVWGGYLCLVPGPEGGPPVFYQVWCGGNLCLVPGPEGGGGVLAIWCQVQCNVWCGGSYLSLVLGPVPGLVPCLVWVLPLSGARSRGGGVCPCLVPGSVPCLVWGVTSVWCQFRRGVPLSGARSCVGVTSVWYQVRRAGPPVWCQFRCNMLKQPSVIS